MKYILMVSGPLCSGKTSLVDVFLKNEKRLFRASFDKIKQQISDFDGERDRMLVKELLFALSEEVIKQGLSIIIEGSANILIEMRTFYAELARKYDIKFLEINIEASVDTLLARLKERVAAGKSITVSEPSQLMKRYDLYLEKKNRSAPVYNSETNSPQDLYLLVIKDLFQGKYETI